MDSTRKFIDRMVGCGEEKKYDVMRKKLNVPDLMNPSFYSLGVRAMGYQNMYKALCDIVDNSIEPNVAATFVKVETDGKYNKGFTTITVIDDGCGMDALTLEEALKLGSNTGKDASINMGRYGTGMKSAALSIGQRLDVYTKTDDGDILHGFIDISDSNSIDAAIEGVDDEETIKMFNNAVKKNHGTIVVISKIDRASTYNVVSFSNTLARRIGLTYNKFIFGNKCKFFTNAGEVTGVDPIGYNVGADFKPLTPEIGSVDDNGNVNGKFTVHGCDFYYRAYEIDTKSPKNKNNKDLVPTNNRNSGIYVYRNNRLVGIVNYGLLGANVKHPEFNGYRVEMFCDGNADVIWGCQLTKEVVDRLEDEANKELYTAINESLCNSTLVYKRHLSERSKNEPDENEEEKNENYKKVVDDLNDSPYLKTSTITWGKNKKHEDDGNPEKEDKKEKEHKKQMNPNPHKKRTDSWLKDVVEKDLGSTEKIFVEDRDENGRPVIIINKAHPFYKCYNTMDYDQQAIIAKAFAVVIKAKEEVNYYTDEYACNIIDIYEETVSRQLTMALK